MFWIALSSFWCWLIVREFRSPAATGVWKPYVGILSGLALICIWQPIHTWLFQRQMSAIATELAEGHVAHLHCNSVLDTMFDPNSTNIGHASPQTGAIAFQYPWCNTLMAYIRHPQRADREELASLGMLTHESMHVRGEMNEARTECQAVQRNYRTAKMLGVPERIAKRNALDYYYSLYESRSFDGPNPYFSDQCVPGGALDERLGDSSWASHY
jgi:hypothetical protein